MIKRNQLIVHIKNKNNVARAFKEMGASVEYVSKKDDYVIIYIDNEKKDRFIDAITKMSDVKSYEETLVDLVELDI